ncbi:MAG: hypothetical protein KAS67_01245, partial [Thermoplasmata archaeon]|nr:hypothetical protein [Thermoplasmata archaeon]
WDDGVIFSVNTDGSFYSVLHVFGSIGGDGLNPYGNLLEIGGTFYGMTYYGGIGVGVVFSINWDGSGYTILRPFANTPDGAYPVGSLEYDGGSFLYGTTRSGGASNYGTIFEISTDGLMYTVVRSFAAGVEGYYPYDNLLYDSGFLYGHTNSGGNVGYGVVYEVWTDGSMYTVVHSFDAVMTDGAYPYCSITQDANNPDQLFGTTYEGGDGGDGILFKINKDSTGFEIMHHFDWDAGASNGAWPYGNSVIQIGSTLYGMTNDGGANSRGIIYKIDTDGTSFSILHSFSAAPDASYPQGDLTWDGTYLYGMTGSGGLNNYGALFRIDQFGAGYTILHDFNIAPAASDPYGNLMDDGAFLYGMTYRGGINNFGTVFKFQKLTSTLTIIHNFTSADGEYPYGGLTTDGTYLYGMTYSGGATDDGVIFRMNKDGSGYAIMRHLLAVTDGESPRRNLHLDGNLLYGMTANGGANGMGTVFSIDKDTTAFTVIHDLAGAPNDGSWPSYNDITLIVNPAAQSQGNLIYHNNFIDNIQQAQDDILGPPGNAWDSGLPDGGNYWSDYAGIDMPPDGIGDTGYPIPGGALATDNWPWMREDGWRLPYSTFTSVAWDDLNGRFWLTCEVSADAASTVYYVPVGTPSTMVPIMAPPITFTAVGADNLGNILIAGDNLDQMFYYNPSADNGWPVTEIGTDKMWGWNITSITFNSNDGRFYLVGNLMNQDKGVAFHTDTVPLDSGVAKCYKDTSAFMNSPEPGALKSIAWNPTRNYALVVGDGVYRVSQYDGNPGYELSWTEVSAPSAGITYSDVSWDTDGWNEAGISGDDNTFGSYWRYYHTNPILQDGFTNGTAGTSYSTCAMKPPSSPKWLLVLGASGGLQVNIQELDQSTDVSASTVYPNIYWVGFNDTGMTSLNNQNVNPDSWFNIVFEGNYSGGWNQVRADITFWFDDGLTGTNSQYPAETVTNRNRAFNLTYEPASATPYVINYPIAPALEITIGVVSDTISWNHPFDATQSFHRVVLQVHLGAQIFPADGNGFAPAGPDYHSDPNIALNNPNSWDFNVTLVDAGDESKTNSTYGEFGVKKAISIGISGSPNGEGTPGDNGVYLGSSVITYSTNADYWVNVSIPHLYLNGEVGHLRYIPAENMLVVNTNSLSNLPMASNMPLAGGGVYFPSENGEICVWGDSATGSLSAPANGTTAHGPWGSNYNYYDNPGGTTSVDWYVDLPAGLGSGTYRATISYSIETDG